MTAQQAPALTLTEFLLARIAEKEAALREIQRRVASDPGSFVVLGLAHPELAAGDCPSDLGEYELDQALTECKAKRRIVARHEDNETSLHRCAWGEWTDGPCDDLRDLASVYSDHPDHREEWRP